MLGKIRSTQVGHESWLSKPKVAGSIPVARSSSPRRTLSLTFSPGPSNLISPNNLSSNKHVLHVGVYFELVLQFTRMTPQQVKGTPTRRESVSSSERKRTPEITPKMGARKKKE